jgi:ubiquinone/menaquinone biosynthesis C-methylase UbiE
MPDFSRRTLLPEKMDQPGVPAKEIFQALHELEIINKWLGGHNVILNGLKKVVTGNSFTLIDLGCGGGDSLRKISSWSENRKISSQLTGVDMNPVMIEYSKKKSAGVKNIDFMVMNIFDEELENYTADIAMNSLFCHHFTNEELVILIKRMQKLSVKAVLINDLHRHWFAYYSIKLITKYFSKSYLVKYDGPLSVARSLNRAEWETILRLAGVRKYSLRWKWAWRWQLIIYPELENGK